MHDPEDLHDDELDELVEDSHFEIKGPIDDEEYDEDPPSISLVDLPGGGGGIKSKKQRELNEALEREWREEDEAPGGEPGFHIDDSLGDEAEEMADDDPLDIDPDEIGQGLASSSENEETAEGKVDQGEIEEILWYRQYDVATRKQKKRRFRELPAHVDPNDLQQTGWGVIFPRGLDARIRHALEPLLKRRKQQAGERYKELDYRKGETAHSFLWYRNGVSPGILDTKKFPFYLLIVGSPEEISFSVQYQLAVNHAVGRIYFENVEDYHRYAESVVAAETRGVDLPKRAVFFAVENADDEATQLLTEKMVKPVSQNLSTYPHGWNIETWSKEMAYKRDLARLMGGDATPGLLLVSAHGKWMPGGHDEQEKLQGAPLCQDWPGKGWDGEAGPEHFFHAGDLGSETSVKGLITFLFSCYGAGTPQEDNFPRAKKSVTGEIGYQQRAIAKRPFVAHLPQALLGRGALAVVGHIDRGWTLSYSWESNDQSVVTTASLEDCLNRLLAGARVGAAMRSLYRRYMSLASFLAVPLERARQGRPVLDPMHLAFLWQAHNDARNFVVLGDPAVALLGGQDRQAARGFPRVRAARGVGGGELRSWPVYLPNELWVKALTLAQEKGVSPQSWIQEVLSREIAA